MNYNQKRAILGEQTFQNYGFNIENDHMCFYVDFVDYNLVRKW